MKDQGEQCVLLYDSGQRIGKLWFDTPIKTRIEHCAVIGRDARDARDEDTWFVLLLSSVGEKLYARLGVGTIKPHYISDVSIWGFLV